MGDFSLFVKWDSQNLMEMVESCAQYTSENNGENTSNLHDDTFNIFESILNDRKEEINMPRRSSFDFRNLSFSTRRVLPFWRSSANRK